MSHFFYRLTSALVMPVMQVAALFSPKMKLWVQGRQHWRSRLRAQCQGFGAAPVLWVHAASLGEFEQGRPLIERWRTEYPEWKVILTFFSPSGYEIRKNYPQAHAVAYLPVDTRSNARDFLDIVQPRLAIFVKYEFWPHYLQALRAAQVPTLLISAIFREKQPFFQPWGGFWRSMLPCFNHIFVQNALSAALLRRVDYTTVTVSGDTRIDRVRQIAIEAAADSVVAMFVQSAAAVLVVGSSWPPDEKLLINVLQHVDFQQIKVIIAPHEIHETHLQALETLLSAETAVRYSQADQSPEQLSAARWLIVDNIGKLNTLYRYATLGAYIGGGFGKGIHNTLEPAAFGLPIAFGPQYHKFTEAVQLVTDGGAFSVDNESDLQQVLRQWLQPDFRQQAGGIVTRYMETNRGATEAIFGWVQQNLNLLP
jgi:3-deoxy-D-manno-octulosonic-acid transferase